MELMHFGPLHAVSTIRRCGNLIGGVGKESRLQGVHFSRLNSKISKALLHVADALSYCAWADRFGPAPERGHTA
jgi:hypothetical protein